MSELNERPGILRVMGRGRGGGMHRTTGCIPESDFLFRQTEPTYRMRWLDLQDQRKMLMVVLSQAVF